jgi:hypothetical protein
MTLAHEKFTVQTNFKDYIGTISLACPLCNHASIELLKNIADKLLALDNSAVLGLYAQATRRKSIQHCWRIWSATVSSWHLTDLVPHPLLMGSQFPVPSHQYE